MLTTGYNGILDYSLNAELWLLYNRYFASHDENNPTWIIVMSQFAVVVVTKNREQMTRLGVVGLIAVGPTVAMCHWVLCIQTTNPPVSSSIISNLAK
jgi:hypothetical protein